MDIGMMTAERKTQQGVRCRIEEAVPGMAESAGAGPLCFVEQRAALAKESAKGAWNPCSRAVHMTGYRVKKPWPLGQKQGAGT